MNLRPAAKISGLCVVNLRNSLLFRAIYALILNILIRNLPRPDSIRGSSSHAGWLSLPLLLFLVSWQNATLAGAASVADVLDRYQEKVEQRLLPRFRFAGADWPPRAVTLLAIKDQLQLELWALSGDGWHHIRDYRIKGMSGKAGPKLREGDRQVPEGIYRIEKLNPNSSFHLSLKIDYPNAFDREQARREGRRDPGGDIFLHGKDVSRGCLALGDNAVEELFVLTALVGLDNVHVVIAPRDFRHRPPAERIPGQPDWVSGLYRQIASAMGQFPRHDPQQRTSLKR